MVKMFSILLNKIVTMKDDSDWTELYNYVHTLAGIIHKLQH